MFYYTIHRQRKVDTRSEQKTNKEVAACPQTLLHWLHKRNATIPHLRSTAYFSTKMFLQLLITTQTRNKMQKERSAPGIEPGTSSTLKTNHTTRPSGHALKSAHFDIILITV